MLDRNLSSSLAVPHEHELDTAADAADWADAHLTPVVAHPDGGYTFAFVIDVARGHGLDDVGSGPYATAEEAETNRQELAAVEADGVSFTAEELAIEDAYHARQKMAQRDADDNRQWAAGMARVFGGER